VNFVETREQQDVPTQDQVTDCKFTLWPLLRERVLKGSGFLKDSFVLQVFLEYIPFRIGIAGSAASRVLQKFLELYFAWYFSEVTAPSYDVTTVESLKILVRSYLSHLRQHNPNSPQKTSCADEAEEPTVKVNADTCVPRCCSLPAPRGIYRSASTK
jgi:hypothetical protein